MTKLILIMALGIALAACAGETRVVVVTATPVPPTVTPSPPTATPIPPTITPVLWDAEVSGFIASLYQLPNSEAPIMKSLAAGLKVDLLAVTEDKEWVQATADLGDWKGTGWLQVDKLELNVSLDDVKVDTETVFVTPPTRTPAPTELPLSERYAAWLIEQGFTYHIDQYEKEVGRVRLFVNVQENRQTVGYAIRLPSTAEDLANIAAFLEEVGELLDPGHGWDTIRTAFESIEQGFEYGTVWSNGRFVAYKIFKLEGADTYMVIFVFLDKLSVIAHPMILVSSTDCTKPNWEYTYTLSILRVDANSSYRETHTNGYTDTYDMGGLSLGQSIEGNISWNIDEAYAANFEYKDQYFGNDGSSATLIWNCETGEVIQSSWIPAD